MRNMALSFVALFFLVNIQAQCPSGNVTLSTQAQVNQFIIDYPNCTVVNGNLTINGADIVNLNGLSNLVQVTGYLGIYNNTLLQNFTGLENLTTLGASLDVSNNPGLLNANGLSGLTNIGTEIQFFNNPQLQNISSLTSVTGTGGGIWIIQNSQLQSLNGLQNILQIGSDIEIRGNTVLNNITALQNINPSSITPTGGYGLTIKNNPAVSNAYLPIDEINHIESEGNYMLFYTDKKIYKARSTIKQVLELLPDSTFVQVHRAYIVNKTKIEKFSQKSLIIQNIEIPISRNYFSPFT